MEIRPKLKPELSAADKIFEISGWAALAILWVLTSFIYSNLPEIIPIHFDASGQANDHENKLAIMFLPVIVTLVFIGLTVLNQYPHIFNYPTKITPENAIRQYRNATSMIRFLKFILSIVGCLIILMISLTVAGKSGGISVWLQPLILGLILIPLSFFIVKAIRIK